MLEMSNYDNYISPFSRLMLMYWSIGVSAGNITLAAISLWSTFGHNPSPNDQGLPL